ncbi:hypothetical protein [Falsiroseomonas bella]|uniref:hypothetical protein n=1 Tax=Falsiroseomonas bella TaxID=2184016 RepID=UPI001304B161|nr:hypothetical protein [Falsiroseomonas bella]
MSADPAGAIHRADESRLLPAHLAVIALQDRAIHQHVAQAADKVIEARRDGVAPVENAAINVLRIACSSLIAARRPRAGALIGRRAERLTGPATPPHAFLRER